MKFPENTPSCLPSDLAPAIEAGVADTGNGTCMLDQVAIEECLPKRDDCLGGKFGGAQWSPTLMISPHAVLRLPELPFFIACSL